MTIAIHENTGGTTPPTQVEEPDAWTESDESEYRELLASLAQNLNDEVAAWTERGIHFASYTEYLYVKEWAHFYIPWVGRGGRLVTDFWSFPDEDIRRAVELVRSEPWWMPPLEPEVQEAANREVARIRSVMNDPWEPLRLGRLRQVIGAMRHPHADPFIEWPKPTVWYETPAMPSASTNETAPDGPGATQQEETGMTAGLAQTTMTEALLALKLRLFSEDEFDNRPEPEWLIEGVLPKGGLAYVIGEPGAGKTFVMVDFVYGVGTGMPWWGHAIKEPGTVLYIAAEDASGLQLRARSWRQRHLNGRTTGRVHFLDAAPQVADPDAREALVQIAIEIQPTLIVVDTQARVTAGMDENNAKDMSTLLNLVDRIQRTTKSAVVLVHHPARGGKAPRGIGSQEGAADVVIFVDKDDDDVITVKNTKQKNGPEFESLTLKLESEGRSAVLVDAVKPKWIGEIEAARMMDRLGIPVKAGRPTVTKILEEKGHHIAKPIIEGALRIRKAPGYTPDEPTGLDGPA